MTITIQIGNSDNKLTQQEWAAFCQDILHCIKYHSLETHFYGCSFGALPWQNACWVVNSSPRTNISHFKEAIVLTRKGFRQNSVAWTEGETSQI